MRQNSQSLLQFAVPVISSILASAVFCMVLFRGTASATGRKTPLAVSSAAPSPPVPAPLEKSPEIPARPRAASHRANVVEAPMRQKPTRVDSADREQMQLIH